MEVKASVYLINKTNTSFKGNASISLNDDFIVRGIRIIDAGKGPFVAMPAQKIGENYRDVCFAKSEELRNQINHTVLDTYNQELARVQEQSNKQTEEQNADEPSKTETTKRSKGQRKSQKADTQSQAAPETADLSPEGTEPVEDDPGMNMGM